MAEQDTEQAEQPAAEAPAQRGFYRPGGGKGKKSFLKRRATKVIIGALVSALLPGLYWVFLFFAEPFQIVQFAQTFHAHNYSSRVERVTVGRLPDILDSLFSKNPDADHLSFFGKQTANRAMRQLVESNYEFKMADGSIINARNKHEINSLTAYDIEELRLTENGRVVQSAQFRDRRAAKGMIKETSGLTAISRVTAPIETRMLIKRLRLRQVDFLYNFGRRRRTAEPEDYDIENRKETRGVVREGDVEAETNGNGRKKIDSDYEPAQPADPEGCAANPGGPECDPADPNDKDYEELAKEGDANADQDLASYGADADNPEADPPSSQRIAARRALGSASIVGTAIGFGCTLWALYQDTENIYENIYIPLARYGVLFMSLGDQIKSGEIDDVAQLGAYTRRITNEHETWVNTAAFQRAIGNQNTKDVPDLPGDVVTSKARLNGIFSEIGRYIGNIPGSGAVCGAVASEKGQKVFFAIDMVATVVEAIGTGGQATWLKRVQVLGTEGAKEFAGDQAMSYLFERFLVGTGAKFVVNGLEDPQDLTNMVDAGMNIASNETIRTWGGRVLTAAEVLIIGENHQQQRLAEYKSKSLGYKLFALSDPRSAAGKLLNSHPRSSGELLAIIGRLPQYISRSVASIFNPQPLVFADETFDNYGLPQYGFTDEELNYDIVQDPVQNGKIVENERKNNPDLFEKWDKRCFQIDPNTSDDPDPHTKDTDPDHEHHAANALETQEKYSDFCGAKYDPGTGENEMFLRYRFYLLDKAMVESINCFGSNESCVGLASDDSDDDDDDDDPPADGEIVYPPNLGGCDGPHGYCFWPDATAGEYTINTGSTCNAQRYGSKELTGVMYTAIVNTRKTIPTFTGRTWDLNASGHASHKKGIDVDLDARNAGKYVANYQAAGGLNSANYDRAATIEFGKRFLDTKRIVYIFYNDSVVANELNAYAQANGLPGVVSTNEPGHDNHFHIRINTAGGPTHAPSC